MESREVFKLFYYQERGRFIIFITMVVFSLFCFNSLLLGIEIKIILMTF